MEIKKENAGIVKKITGFLKETEVEAKKVVWPERRYVFAATIIVLVIVILSSLYIMALDFGFGKMFEIVYSIVKPGMGR